MSSIRRSALCACALALTLAAAPPVAAAADSAAPAVRTLAAIPFYAPERMWQLYEPLVDYLTRAAGEKWELKLFPNHETMIEGVCAGTVDVTLLGPVPLGRVNRKCGAVPILVALGKDGQPVYHSMLLTADPAVTSVAGLRGRKVGFLKGSTAAHVLPLRMLGDAGLGPGAYQPVFLESQDRIVTALLAHEIDGAGVKEALYRRFQGEPALRLLQTSEALPNFAFVTLPSQPAEVRERFAAALLKLHPFESGRDAETVKGWDDEVRNGFTRPAPDFLPAVLGLADVAEKLVHGSR